MPLSAYPQSGKYFIGLNLTNGLCQTGIGKKKTQGLFCTLYILRLLNQTS